MTTMTEPTTAALPPYRADQRVTQLRVLRSEWTKLRSLASTAWCLLVTVALVVGVGVAYTVLRVARPPQGAAALASWDPTAISLAGIQLAEFAIGVLGVLLITGEYATGMVRTSFAAVPARLPVLWGKAIVFLLTTLVLCVPASFVAFLAGQSILSSGHLNTSLSQPGTARAVLGGGLYLAIVGLLGLGLGALLRNTAGATAALFGVLFAPQLIVGFLPETWSDQIYRYLPAPAGQAVTTVRPDPTLLAPWTGFGLLCLYAAILLGLAAWRMRRRSV
jgi:ABC-type transport system involved in multi-copper enzyme maturation permease subunit